MKTEEIFDKAMEWVDQDLNEERSFFLLASSPTEGCLRYSCADANDMRTLLYYASKDEQFRLIAKAVIDDYEIARRERKKKLKIRYDGSTLC